MSEQKSQQMPPAQSETGPADLPVVSPLGAIPSRGEGRSVSFGQRIFLRLAHLWFLLSRGMTLGVRAIVVDREERVFLVRHSYVPGWHLPGGGVEVGETLENALAKELREEGNLQLTAPARLIGVYLNLSASRRDHVALYRVDDFIQSSSRAPDHEIVESGFFPLHALPEGTTLGTRRRLDEVFGSAPLSAHW